MQKQKNYKKVNFMDDEEFRAPGIKRSGGTLYYTFPNGKTIRVGSSRLLRNYENIMGQFDEGIEEAGKV